MADEGVREHVSGGSSVCVCEDDVRGLQHIDGENGGTKRGD